MLIHLLNPVILAASLALELLLLIRLCRTRIALTFSAFTVLLVFYVLRSALLFAFSAHSRSPAYSVIYSALALVDVLLQTLVAWQLFLQAGKVPAPLTRLRPLTMFAVLGALSALVSLLLAHTVPAIPRSPLDRGVIFTAALMAGVGIASAWSRLTPNASRLLQGFLALSFSSAITQVGRTFAAFDRNAGAFRAWSYTAAVVYLLVLAFWLIRLRAAPSPLLQSRIATS